MTTEPTPTPDNVTPENELARRRAIVENVDGATDALIELAKSYLALSRELEVPTADWLEMVLMRLPEDIAEPIRVHVAAPLLDMIAPLVMGAPFGEVLAKAPSLLMALIGRRGETPPAGIKAAGELGMLIGSRLGPQVDQEEDRDAPEAEANRPTDRQRDLISSGTDGELAHARMRMVIGRLFEDGPKMMLPDGTPDPSQAPALPCHVVLRGSVPPIEGVLSTTPEGGLRMMTPHKKDNGQRAMIEQFFDYADVIAVAVEREIAATASRIVRS